MRRAALGAALGLVVVLAALVLVLSQRDPRLAYTNSFVQYSGLALPVAPGKERCARDQVVPEGAEAVLVYAGTSGRRRGEPLELTVFDGRRRVTSGGIGGDYGDNAILRIPVQRVEREVGDARVCVRNLGRRRVQFAGNLTPQVGPMPGGVDVVRTDWLLAGEPTWWDVAPRIARRASVFKPGFVGGWTFFALAAVVAAGWVAGIAVVARSADE